MGNLLAVNVHKANQHDTKGGVFVFEKALFLYPSIEAGCADEGYRGTFKNTFEMFHNVRIDISRQIKPAFEILPKRWRVERASQNILCKSKIIQSNKGLKFKRALIFPLNCKVPKS